MQQWEGEDFRPGVRLYLNFDVVSSVLNRTSSFSGKASTSICYPSRSVNGKLITPSITITRRRFGLVRRRPRRLQNSLVPPNRSQCTYNFCSYPLMSINFSLQTRFPVFRPRSGPAPGTRTRRAQGMHFIIMFLSVIHSATRGKMGLQLLFVNQDLTTHPKNSKPSAQLRKNS